MFIGDVPVKLSVPVNLYYKYGLLSIDYYINGVRTICFCLKKSYLNMPLLPIQPKYQKPGHKNI